MDVRPSAEPTGEIMSTAVKNYTYPRLSEDWDFWIITMNVEREVGKKPEGIIGNMSNVTLYFKELTDDEKRSLDEIMSDVNVGLLPKTTEGHTVFKVKDLWDYRSIIERVVGKRLKWVHFPPALPDGTHMIELWVEGELTHDEIEKVKKAYASLISET